MNDNYQPLAKYYDVLSRWYSLGEIINCREAYLVEIFDAAKKLNESEELRVCFVGVGHGIEAIKVAEAGAKVTVVDSSESMLEAFEKNLSLAPPEVQARVQVVHEDVREFAEQEQAYDWVIANFFLNVFDQVEVYQVLKDLMSFCTVKGSLVISDFHLTRGAVFGIHRWLIQCLQKAYWYIALIIFRLWVKNAFHPVYDYQNLLSKSGWKVVEEKRFGFLGIHYFQSMRIQVIVW